MSSEAVRAFSPRAEAAVAGPAAPGRVWPAVALVGLFWAFFLVSGSLELPMFTRFMSRVAATGLLVLLFAAWWGLNRSIRLTDRLLGLGTALAGAAGAALLSRTEAGLFPWFLLSVPVVVTAWAGWLLVSRTAPAPVRRLGLLATLG